MSVTEQINSFCYDLEAVEIQTKHYTQSDWVVSECVTRLQLHAPTCWPLSLIKRKRRIWQETAWEFISRAATLAGDRSRSLGTEYDTRLVCSKKHYSDSKTMFCLWQNGRWML